MKDLIKMIVTDSAGVEHEFEEIPGDIENYLELNPTDISGRAIIKITPADWAVRIITRTFTAGDTFDTERESLFYSPRRIDVIYGNDDGL